MPNQKCHSCDVIDSVHRNDEARSKLIWAFGPLDEDGLQMHFIYCRACGAVNIYKPGWFGNLKFSSYIDTKELFKLFQSGKIERDEIGILARKIQLVMIEDKRLPQDWKVI